MVKAAGITKGFRAYILLLFIKEGRQIVTELRMSGPNGPKKEGLCRVVAVCTDADGKHSSKVVLIPS